MMQKAFQSVLFVVATMLAATHVFALDDGGEQNEPKLNQSIVRFRSNINKDKAEYIISQSGFAVVKYIPQLNMYVVEPVGKTNDRDKLNKAFGVMYAEPNGILTMDDAPNDKKYSSQWHHRNIKSELAWNTTTGSGDVIVAVVDTGVTLNHEDLKKQIWANKNEIADNGIDDDKNGYVDDVHGWDFINHDNNPNDDQSHGTHCAGIIGALGNNGIGTTGVAWNVQIMPLKFLSASGSGSEDDAVIANIYAADNGARVISASWGSTEFSQSLRDSIQYAADKGVLFVAAAGNDKANNDRSGHYPSNFDVTNVISVGASTSSNGKADFSNFGKTRVHVAAPGSNILSTSLGKSGYETKSGTSMATPVVSGLAALILSVRPELSVQDLKNAILNSVVQNKSWGDKNATGGIVRSDFAVQQLSAGPQVWPSHLRILQGTSYQLSANAIARAQWTTSDEKILTVASDGTIVGVAQGKAVVTATSGNVSASALIEVLGLDTGSGCAKVANSETGNDVSAQTSLLILVPLMLTVFYRKRRPNI